MKNNVLTSSQKNCQPSCDGNRSSRTYGHCYSNCDFSYTDFRISRSDFPISHSDFSISNIDYWNSIGDFELIPLLSCFACHTLAQYVEPLWVTQSTMKYHSWNSSRQFCNVIQLSALSSLHVFHAILRCLDWYLVIWNRNQNALKTKEYIIYIYWRRIWWRVMQEACLSSISFQSLKLQHIHTKCAEYL